MALGQGFVGLAAGARDGDHARTGVLKGGVDGLAGPSGAQDQALPRPQRLGRGAAEVALAEALEHPGKAQDVGVVGVDGSVGTADERVCHAQTQHALAHLVGKLGGLALVGDGHVETAPRAPVDKAGQLLGLQLVELVGHASQARVDLRRPAVAKLAAQKAERGHVLACLLRH